ncbi:hypothetical protein [Mycobacterium sp.]|uniref:hypothetical protein n=1 Tax=Mycobacterium sp. TaxID=1785 RepID=UPI003C71107E
MSDGEQTEPPEDSADSEGDSTPEPEEDEAEEDEAEEGEAEDEDDESAGDGIFSGYGIASSVLAVLSIAAIVLGGLIWAAHRDDTGERVYLTRVMQSAAEWTGVLINMNAGNVAASLQKLHEGTVGDLNSDFDAAVQPYRQVVEKLQTQSNGQIEAVAIETVHRDLDSRPGEARPVVTTKLPPFATRTDSVMVIATSIAENAGAKPQTVHWNLRLDVSNVDGKLMISKLESIK